MIEPSWPTTLARNIQFGHTAAVPRITAAEGPRAPAFTWGRALGIALTLWSSLAFAQEEAREAAPTGRAAYEQGAAAAAEERWDAAHEAFARSYELSGAPSAGFNAAMALRAQGRHVEARAALSSLLERHPHWEHNDAVRERLAEENHTVAFLQLDAIDPPTASLRLDGRPIPFTTEPIPLDPAEHVLRAEAPGHAPFDWTGSLAPGERRTLTIQLASIGGDSVAESPWLWIAIGAVLVGGGVLAAVLIDDSLQLAPESENTVRF